MTAREELMQLMDRLTEAEAEACLKAVAEKRDAPKKKWHDPREDEWPTPGKPVAEVRRFLQELRETGPTISDAEWEEVTRSLDDSRPHRPLFH